jgi:hypothetical protein
MSADQLREIVGRKPFRPVEVATTSGDHYQLLDESYVLNSARRPELFFFFTGEGLARLVEANEIANVTVL